MNVQIKRNMFYEKGIFTKKRILIANVNFHHFVFHVIKNPLPDINHLFLADIIQLYCCSNSLKALTLTIIFGRFNLLSAASAHPV